MQEIGQEIGLGANCDLELLHAGPTSQSVITVAQGAGGCGSVGSVLNSQAIGDHNGLNFIASGDFLEGLSIGHTNSIAQIELISASSAEGIA